MKLAHICKILCHQVCNLNLGILTYNQVFKKKLQGTIKDKKLSVQVPKSILV